MSTSLTRLLRYRLVQAGGALAVVAAVAASIAWSDRDEGALSGYMGGTFVVVPADASGLRFNVTAELVGQGSIVGNFTDLVHLQAQFPPPGTDQPTVSAGTATWTTSDGQSTLTFNLAGTASFDPANPSIFNAHYRATVTGGTGAFARARGAAALNEVGQFNATLTGGKVALTFKGHVRELPN